MNQNPKKAGAPRDEADTLLPPVDVTEDAAGISLVADLPGVPKEKLSLQVEADKLTIEGEIVLALPEGMQPTHVEVGPLRYRRVFTLSNELDAEHVAAEFRHGVLRLRIPRKQKAQPKRIQIQVG